MDLSLTEPQELLRASARSFVDREAPRHAIVAAQRGDVSLTPELWRKASGLGRAAVRARTKASLRRATRIGLRR